VKVTKDQKVAVGRALQELKKDVRSAEIDGERVDPGEAVQAAEELSDAARAEAQDPSLLRSAGDKLESWTDGLRGKIGGTDLGRKAQAAMSADPERVWHEARLVVETVGGERLEMKIPVVHLNATAWLQKASMISEMASMVPIAGLFVAPAASLMSALGSLVARATGQEEVADAMMGTARKHLMLSGANLIPGVGLAASAVAVLEDRKNLHNLDNPSVDAIVNLAPKNPA
jgi:hypothetical protein